MNPYSVLGLKPGADLDSAKSAFRRLAKTCHPDARPGDPKAARRFQEISTAYDMIVRGEQSDKARSDFWTTAHAWARAPRQGAHRRARIDVSLSEAVNGCERRIEVSRGVIISARFPPGLEHGCVMRLRGKGEPGRNGGAPGDALIDVSVRTDPLFRLNGADVHLRFRAPPRQLARGGVIEAPTPHGAVKLTIPAGTRPGQTLRLRGLGLPKRADRPAGDLYVTLRLGDTLEPIASAA